MISIGAVTPPHLFNEVNDMMTLKKVLADELVKIFPEFFIDYIEDVNDPDLKCEVTGERDVNQLCIVRKINE
jgi:hypothetical protein